MMMITDFDFTACLTTEEEIQDFLQDVLNEDNISSQTVSEAYIIAEQARAKLANEKPSIGTAKMFFDLWQRQHQQKTSFA